MKVIKHEDLKLLIPLVTDCPTWSINDFKKLLDRFGSDYFIEDGEFVETGINEEMAQIRKNLIGD